jgi:hypothetical protein
MSGSGIFAGEANGDAEEPAAATPGRAASRNYQVLLSKSTSLVVMLLLLASRGITTTVCANLLLLRMTLMYCTDCKLWRCTLECFFSFTTLCAGNNAACFLDRAKLCCVQHIFMYLIPKPFSQENRLYKSYVSFSESKRIPSSSLIRRVCSELCDRRSSV